MCKILPQLSRNDSLIKRLHHQILTLEAERTESMLVHSMWAIILVNVVGTIFYCAGDFNCFSIT